MHFGTLYQRPERKTKFVSQTHPTKILKIRAFLKTSKKLFAE